MTACVRDRKWDWLNRIVAVCLLVLVVSPFTAPFSTCDFSHGPQASPLDDPAPAKDKVSQHALLAPGFCSVPLVLDPIRHIEPTHIIVGLLPTSAPTPLRI
jgi:hypothetical protein